MLKIFVVENEPFIRKGIITYINRKSEEFQVVGEAGDGEIAYPEIIKTEPDILITDIMMPYMNGLELGELLQEKLPDLNLIITSGYREFVYARRAIRIGVVDYLLKPIFEEDLFASIYKAQTEILEDRKYKSMTEELKWARKRKEELQNGLLSLGQVDIKTWNKNSIEIFLKKGLKKEAKEFTDKYIESAGEDNMESVLFRQYVVIDIQLAAISFLSELKDDTGLGSLVKDTQEFSSHIKSREETREYIRQMLERCIEIRDSLAGNQHGWMIEKAKGYIQNHFYKDISLNSVADYVGISPNHFSRIFSQETGTTFIDYLTQVRMVHAEEMLRCTNQKISEICEKIGYRDSNYFYTLFKKRYGCTPSAYRKKRN